MGTDWTGAEERKIINTGTAKFTLALKDATAVIDGGPVAGGQGAHYVTFTSDGHGLGVGTNVYLEGAGIPTYNGKVYEIAKKTTNTFSIIFYGTFVADTQASGTDKWTVAIGPQQKWRITSYFFHLDAADSTDEALTGTLDAGDGATYDAVIIDEDTADLADIPRTANGIPIPFEADDIMEFAWVNTGSQVWSLTVNIETAGRG